VVEILFFSNLIESKGVFLLLQSCIILREKQLSFRCTIAGGEGDINSVQFQKRVCEMELEQYVRYIGPKYGSEKIITFLKSDIFVFPTYYHNECFPLVLLEAMKYSLPVISTFEGGIRSIVDEGQTGFLVPQKNTEVLAEKIETLINNPSMREQMGKAGYQKYQKQFTLTIFENKLKEILTDIIENK
jgi:glycosyltransferase involved in cell wall biosynthesis